MWFDTEILAREMASIFPTPKPLQTENESCVEIFLEDLGIKSEIRLGLSRIHPSSEDALLRIEKPLLAATYFDMLMKKNKRALRQQYGPEKQIFVCPEASATPCRLPELELPCLVKSMDDFFKDHRGNFHNATKIINAQVKAIEGSCGSYQMIEVPVWKPTHNFQTKEPAFVNNATLHPITKKGPLLYSMKNCTFMAPSKHSSRLSTLKPPIADLKSLIPYIRRWLTIELGHWNPGPREIILKSKYSWHKILHDMPTLDLDVFLSSGYSPREYQERSTRPAAAVSSLLDPDLNTFLDQIVQSNDRDTLINSTWKQFLIALKNEQLAESVNTNQRRIHQLRTQLFAFDPPARVQCPISSVTIKSMYDTSCRGTTDAAVIPERLGASGQTSSSQKNSESSLSIFENAVDMREDRDMEEPLGVLLGLCARQSGTEEILELGTRDNALIDARDFGDPALDSQMQQHFNSASEARESQLEQNPSGHPRSPLAYSREVEFHTPHNAMCSPWSLKVAEFCIRVMKRGTVFLPPPLSILPSLAAIAHSYTSASLCDYRVLIVCEANTQMISTLQGYLDSIYDGTISIEIVRRRDRESYPTLASLSFTLARVVIIDSFDFDIIPDFAVLLILGPGTQSLFSVAEGPPIHNRGVPSHLSSWTAIPSILILPYHQCNGVESYLSRATLLASLLGIDEALVVDESDDVLISALLSRPDFIFLVPSREVFEFLGILEIHASDYLPVYNRLLQQNQGFFHTKLEANRLSDIRLDIIEAILLAGDHERQKLDDALGILLALRQTRSYALQDGNRIAVEFLKHYVQEVSASSSDVFQPLFDKVQEKGLINTDVDKGFHPMTFPLKKSLDEMGLAMRKEAPSLRRVHRHHVFRPLIITNSSEACDAFLKEIPGAVDICEAQDEEVGICVSRDLQANGGRKQTLDGYARNAREAIPEFSHVLHILDDRKPVAPAEVLPPELLQSAICGKTRLVTVAVDESRSLDIAWRRNESNYSRICKAARRAEQLIRGTKDGNLLHIHLSVIACLDLGKSLAAASTVLRQGSLLTLQSELPAEKSRPSNGQRHMLERPHIICSKGDEHAEYQISVAQILKQPISSLRAKLKAALESVQDCSNTSRHLTVIVKAADTKKWTPAITSILSAVAGDKSLYRYVDVHVG